MSWFGDTFGTRLGGAALGTVLLPGIGTLIGSSLGGSVEDERNARELQKQQESLARGEQAKNAANVARIRAIFGVLPKSDNKGARPEDKIVNPAFGKVASYNANSDEQKKWDTRNETFRANLANATGKRAKFTSNIESGLAAARDEGQTNNLAGFQNAVQQGRFSAARSGLTGSSQDTANRRLALGGYLQGRSNIVRGIGTGRQQAWSALDTERRALEGQARTLGKTPLDSVMAAQRGLSAIESAKANIVPGTFGDTLGTGASLVAQGAIQGARGNAGLRALGLSNGTFTPQRT